MYKIPEQISAKLCLKSVLGHLTHTKFEIFQVAGRLKVAGVSNDCIMCMELALQHKELARFNRVRWGI